MGEINAEIDKLPPWVKAKFKDDPRKKLEFFRQYVATELLYDKGLKLGAAKDPEITKKMDLVLKQLVVQKIMKQEVLDKITINDDDVKNYYLANQEKYKIEIPEGEKVEGEEEKEPEVIIKPFEEVKGQVSAEYRQQKESAMVGDVINKILQVKDVVLYEDKFIAKKQAKVEEEKK